MDNADIKKLIQDKLERAKTSKKVSALKSKTANKTGRVKSEDIAAQLDEVADVQVKKNATIQVPTLIMVDASSSMNRAIDCGKNVAALVSGATSAGVYAVVFNEVGRTLDLPENCTMTQAERAFAGVRAGGCTSIGSGLARATRDKIYVEQIVVITDEEENTHPYFVDAYRAYEKNMGVSPSVVIIRVQFDPRAGWGGDQKISTTMAKAGIEFDVYDADGKDYYAMPGLIPMLSQKSKVDLLMEILDSKLPTRKPFSARRKR
jgi:hypothetical protein